MQKQKQKAMATHTPVLLREVLECLAPGRGQSYLDLTAGYGGHSGAVLELTKAPGAAVLIDRDEQAIDTLKKLYAGTDAKIIRSDFLSTLGQLSAEGKKFDMILADLGISSPHLENSERGFAFGTSGPLDMRMDRSQELQADHLVNNLPEEKLVKILAENGEEPKARAIARAIVQNRPVKDTQTLAAIIARTVGFRARRAKTHPATRSFQALRIAVNDELAQLEQGLPLMADLLAPEGRLAIISFHSLEDRLVKQFLADKAGRGYDAELKLLTKKPITASRDEIVSNPRARSAKLRAAAKIKTQERV